MIFWTKNYEEALKVAAKKHDLIGIKVYDKMDMELPDAGLLEVEDAETGKIWVDTADFGAQIINNLFLRSPNSVKRFF